MIESKIMLGNWVKHNNDEYWSELFRGKNVLVDIDIFLLVDSKPQLFDPIPLTPEILAACGFTWEKIDMGNKTVDGMVNDILMVIKGENGEYWYAAPFGYAMHPTQSMYLHQIQNIFYILTGKELTYSPK